MQRPPPIDGHPASPAPALACPSCHYSLRGIEPLGLAQVLRCPECGSVTSIGRLAEAHRRRQLDIARLMRIALALASVIALLALAGWMTEDFGTWGGTALAAATALLVCAALALSWTRTSPLRQSAFIIIGSLALLLTDMSALALLTILAFWFMCHIIESHTQLQEFLLARQRSALTALASPAAAASEAGSSSLQRVTPMADRLALAPAPRKQTGARG